MGPAVLVLRYFGFLCQFKYKKSQDCTDPVNWPQPIWRNTPTTQIPWFVLSNSEDTGLCSLQTVKLQPSFLLTFSRLTCPCAHGCATYWTTQPSLNMRTTSRSVLEHSFNKLLLFSFASMSEKCINDIKCNFQVCLEADCSYRRTADTSQQTAPVFLEPNIG